jgi:hypothetical protein
MAKESTAQKKTIERVMHEYKHGELERPGGRKVKDRRQAVAIALSEAGASNRQSPSENRRRLRKTKTKEQSGQTAIARKEGRRYPTTRKTRATRSSTRARRAS